MRKDWSFSVVLVPLNPSGYAVGVVIRSDGRGRAVGAFFGPRVEDGSSVDASALRLEDARLVCCFGDHGIYKKRWPVIGVVPNWKSENWSVTKFVRGHDDPKLCYVTEYDESLNVVSESVLPAAAGEGLPEDAQYGSGVVEAKLAKLLQ